MGTARAWCVLAPNPSPMTLDGTNTWVIAEPGSVVGVVVDPGPDDEEHLRRVLDVASAGDRRVAQIVLTHGHPDHSAGAARFAELTGAPVGALDPAFRLGSEGFGPGAVLDAGGCELRVIATPGHTADSLSLLLTADGGAADGRHRARPGHDGDRRATGRSATTCGRLTSSGRSRTRRACGCCCPGTVRC